MSSKEPSHIKNPFNTLFYVQGRVEQDRRIETRKDIDKTLKVSATKQQ